MPRQNTPAVPRPEEFLRPSQGKAARRNASTDFTHAARAHFTHGGNPWPPRAFILKQTHPGDDTGQHKREHAGKTWARDSKNSHAVCPPYRVHGSFERMRIEELDYHLPPERIAQSPAEPRDSARLLVLDRTTQSIREDVFRNLAAYLRPGDCLALNDTRVIRARLRGEKPSGGQVEIFCLREEGPGVWRALVRPSARVQPGTVIRLAAEQRATIGERLEEGQRRVCFDRADVLGILEAAGEIPLPPYIQREAPDPADHTRYQTVYAARPGAVAAPTAGLHFTPEVFDALSAHGVGKAHLTLHVGYGTFKPITVQAIENHRVDPEDFDLPEATATQLNEARAKGGRIVAVGTTVTRVLESQWKAGRLHPGHGITHTYIYPPYAFRAVDALITNFHLPQSSLLALVYAFATPELTRRAYQYAIERAFRFYSYGDAMLIL
jgi:S-adenosylmethionine:tRNA ribosyltransferase-isomerase